MSIGRRITVVLIGMLAVASVSYWFGTGNEKKSNMHASVNLDNEQQGESATLPLLDEKKQNSSLKGTIFDYALRKPFFDDLSPMIKRRVIRILVSPNQANFMVSGGKIAGFEYELTQQYRNYLETRVRKSIWPVSFIYIPVPFDQLLPALNAGQGDMVAAGLTITKARQTSALFTRAYIKNVSEVLVASENADPIETAEDLSGKTVLVMRGTSYEDSLTAFNQTLVGKGLKPITIKTESKGSITTEDILEMVNFGIVDYTIVDNHLANMWAKVLLKMRIRSDISFNDDGEIAWAVRKRNPELLKSLNIFLETNQQGTLVGNVLFTRYFTDHKWISNPLAGKQVEKLAKLEQLFRKYAAKFDFDWRFLAALAYQESGLSQDAVSHTGAIGIMQVQPRTAAYKPIAISNIDTLEGNIHAGAKYLAYLRDKTKGDKAISAMDQINFILASYNAGPSRLKKLRSATKKRGLDPNKWHSNVALEARRSIGHETVEYVANISKYYVAYKLLSENKTKREKAVKKLKDKI